MTYPYPYHYHYDWDMGPERYLHGLSCQEFNANKPVPEETFLLDTLTGQKYFVEEICPALPPDSPKPVMRTRPAGKLNEEQLDRLRKRAQCTPNEFQLPLDDLVFFTEPEGLQAILT